jgi:AbrB family looped-hinge helix DNA binding protein
MTLTTKGQVTIPQDIREQLGLMPGTRVVFDIVGDGVRIRRAREQARGDAIVQHLRGAGRRAAGPRLSTDQILALTRGA